MLHLPTGFLPAKASVSLGASADWLFAGPGSHTITDTSSMGVFASNSQLPGPTYAFAFTAAGTYAYEDTVSAASGTVVVPLAAKPTKGTVSTVFTIKWATAVPPAGFVEDLQIKRPRHHRVHGLEDRGHVTGGTFTPDPAVGSYSFRAELRNTGNGAHSGSSPNKTIKVS